MRRIFGYYTTCPFCQMEVEVVGGKMVNHDFLWRTTPDRCTGSGREVEDSKVTPVRL